MSCWQATSDIDDGLRSLLRLCREMVVRLGKTESALVGSLERDALLRGRIERLSELGFQHWRHWKFSHHRVRIKGAVNNCVWITSCSFQHIFDFFAKLAIVRHGIGAFDSKQIPSVAC